MLCFIITLITIINEYNYLFRDHPEWIGAATSKEAVEKWIHTLERTAQQIHRIDSRHPVATAWGDLPSPEVEKQVRSVDVWGANLYHWDNPEGAFAAWKERSTKPLYLSEAGADSFDNRRGVVNEEKQAQAVKAIWKDIEANRDIVSGATFMSFNDEWWKAGSPSDHSGKDAGYKHGGVPYDNYSNEEHYGVVTLDRKPKQVYYALKQAWADIAAETKAPAAGIQEDALKLAAQLKTVDQQIAGLQASMARNQAIIETAQEQAGRGGRKGLIGALEEKEPKKDSSAKK